ncbi:hypothetical protein SNE40_019524 [Patella caerulea]|uniref:Uncharacterized protein n=1 Tax=Patella caerulea TaxID=87958 RepID=A0AAN8J7D2_PATCE
MVSLQLAGLLVLAATAFATPVAKRSCAPANSDKTIPHGETFTLESSGPCIKYLCDDASYAPSAIECSNPADGSCHAVGAVLTHNCVTRKCVHDGTVGFQTTVSKCADKDGACHSPGETFARTIAGTDYSNCSCEIEEESGNINYTCSG